ncbi:MAG: hypothetical protein IJV38_07355 [Prevotella sp.]|nr:hypothetical protein [Prevotella sp.]
MNRIFRFGIDMLRLCFEIEEPNIIDYLAKLEPAEKADFYDFYLLRIEGKHFEYVFEIRYDDLGEDKLFGELRFGINKNEDEANTHTNGKRKAWISISNRVLYTTEEMHYLEYIADVLHLELHNITSLDLCLDMSMNIARYLRRLIRCKDMTVILNGKRVTDRKADRPEIIYTMSGNLDRDKYLTVNIKQKKAIKDKSRGSTLAAYDKRAEIANSSSKEYISDLYGWPSKLHRLEVHLNNDEIKDYFNKTGEELNIGTIFNQQFLFRLFFSTLESLIRFERGGKKLDWWAVLEGGITTTPATKEKEKKSPLLKAS